MKWETFTNSQTFLLQIHKRLQIRKFPELNYRHTPYSHTGTKMTK